MASRDAFPGFRPPTSNTTYTPNQFFDVVLRYGSRGVVRLVGYLIRRTLGWSDAEGRPREPEAVISWRELEQRAGIGHSSIAAAIDEALDSRYIVRVREGRPDTAGQSARSASYQLRWDETERYIKVPDAFNGFYAANGNLTYVPNQFFDELVPRETLAVSKVTGAILRHTIGFQTGYGFRRQQVQLSISDLERITRLHRDSVRLALAEALRKGYVARIEPGVFDKTGGQQSRAAVYGPRWQDGFGTPLRKPVRERSGKPHGDRSENPHGLEITGNNKIHKRRPVAAYPAEAQATVERLQALGFDEASVQELLGGYALERIERQLTWLPKRNPRRNARGLLKRAVEEDWPEPRVELPATPAVRFAAGFYAGWSGSKLAALAQPSANDVIGAEPYLERLALGKGEPEAWGREFGAYARRAENGRRDPLVSLVHALRVHGDAYHQFVIERRRKAARLARVAAQHEHQQRHWPEYLDYLRDEERRLQTDAPGTYARFAAHEAKQRQFVERSGLSRRALAAFESEEQRLTRLQLFFAGEAEVEVLDFWGWDERRQQAAAASAASTEGQERRYE